ncbi:hypothetical protein B0H14DRAFT_3424381 [Mycena olivaceomarginata]|nr:hypothetical protein B0H14DRAFT_3424381 [Mycena olivaceomarginata]
MGIGCKWGASDSLGVKYVIVDDTSNKPGEQVFEKLISGRHLAIFGDDDQRHNIQQRPRLPPHPPSRLFTSHVNLRRTASSLSPSLLPSHIPPQQYLYTLHHGLRPAHHWPFLLFVEPSNSKPTPGKYTIRLLLKIDDVERPIRERVSLRLSVDLRKLNFVVL